MSSIASGGEWHARTLRAWQLALLRFAVTLDNADRLAVLAIAAEMDRLHPVQDGNRPLDFSAEPVPSFAPLPAAERSFIHAAAPISGTDRQRTPQPCVRGSHRSRPTKVASTSKSIRRDTGLWRGLSTRDNQTH